MFAPRLGRQKMNANSNSYAMGDDKKQMNEYIRKITSDYLQSELAKLSDKHVQPTNKPAEQAAREKLNGFKFLWTPRYKRYLLTL